MIPTKEQVIQMAEAAGFPFNKYGLLQGDHDDEIDADEMFMRFYVAARAKALEEAAGVCEQQDEDGEGPDCWGWHAKDYARNILALKGKQ